MTTAPPAARPQPTPHPSWLRIRERIAQSRTVVDLGCGPCPVEGATVAVDAFCDNRQRGLGWSPAIDRDVLARRGIRFVEARIDRPLPFGDKEFDFAYSAHVFEHLDDPATACREMSRIARAGVVITPAPFAEIAFGRPYHRWLVVDGRHELLFVEKTEWDYGPFGVPLGSHPDGGYLLTDDTTPFDAILDDGGWYDGTEDFGPVRERLQWHYRSHSPVFEVIFHWDGEFEGRVIRRRPSGENKAPWMPGLPTGYRPA